MMTRGVRGATTVTNNDAEEIITNTKHLLEEMIDKNNIHPEDVSHVFISVTNDINATFPAQALRQLPGWKFVPVMCMREIDVPGSLPKCIRVMMVINTDKNQKEIDHVFHHEAIKLRPDLISEEGDR